MSLYFATKCQSCAGIIYHFIVNSDVLDAELGLLIEPCDKCHEFPNVLYTTEDIAKAQAYNDIIEVIG